MTETIAAPATQETPSAPLHLLVNFSSWCSPVRVIEGSLNSLMDNIRTEVEALRDWGIDGNDLTITVTTKRLTDAEADALPEWDGP